MREPKNTTFTLRTKPETEKEAQLRQQFNSMMEAQMADFQRQLAAGDWRIFGAMPPAVGDRIEVHSSLSMVSGISPRIGVVKKPFMFGSPDKIKAWPVQYEDGGREYCTVVHYWRPAPLPAE